MQAAAFLELPWRDPVDLAAAVADEPHAVCLLSEPGAWSYVALDPDAVLSLQGQGPDPFAALAALLGPPLPGNAAGPPFQGGVIGLAAYELGAQAEGVTLPRRDRWADLVCARYGALLAFDAGARRLLAIGRGADQPEADDAAAKAAAWLRRPSPAGWSAALCADLAGDPAEAYEEAVAEVIERIAAGEIFQANIARRWRGRLAQGARPFDLFARLAADSPAPFAAYLRLPDQALVSNSPERFLAVEARRRHVRAEPIKGTRPRGHDRAADEALAAELAASAKDRAENLMIVDLMRNDLSRVSDAGEVRTPDLYRLRSFANVHHLVSTVTGRLRPGLGAADLLKATLPPGSITGAPKVQAMRVIAELEGPRGPFFGSLFWAGFDGGFDSSVLIRTAAFVHQRDGWDVEARAGAGIVADSDPRAERLETEAKIDALRGALLRSGA